MSQVSRRDFLKYAGGGVAALVIGSKLKWVLDNPYVASAAVPSLSFDITDAMKEMVTFNSLSPAGTGTCYHWVFKDTSVANLPASCPGPNIYATAGDPDIAISITNKLPHPHAFFIPGFGPLDPPLFDSGPIAPGATFTGTIKIAANPAAVPPVPAAKTGAYLYYDNLNEPVNRVMGLHGAFILMPTPRAAPFTAPKLTPYSNPTPNIQALFNAFGGSPAASNPTTGAADTTFIYPGLAWEEGDPNPATFAQPFRNYVWIDHQPSPKLFAEVGNLGATQMTPTEFQTKFLRDPFNATNAGYISQYFTISGQSGHFSHNNPALCPMVRIGEGVVIHILNAGLWTHSMHIHANHFYITSVNGVVQHNPLWIDVFTVRPMDRIDYVFPYMRTPDVPNARGIGRPDMPRTTITNPLIPGSLPHTAWPPNEELSISIPAKAGSLVTSGIPTRVGRTPAGANLDLGVQLSPICYPMHDHSEASQTSEGGNYNCGLISGVNFTGDRNIKAQLGQPAGVTTFPNAPTADMFPRTAEGVNDPAPQF